jgi:glycosyltransferase involved in cell wall biosynthesis
VVEGVSVVICCHNSVTRLGKTLQFLVNQNAGCPWEVLLVDNASTDSTAQFAQEEWMKLGGIVPLQVVYENQPGLTYAREKGIMSAQFECIVLCDDDNYLDSEYVETAFRILSQDDAIGIAGGVIEPEYENPPPPWFHKYAHFLAIGSQSETQGDVTETPGILFGAGMVLRKSAFQKLKAHGFRSILTDRTKQSLMSGGDTEYCIAFRLANYRLYYTEDLRLRHYMPSSRLTIQYLQKLRYAMGRSSIYFIAYYEHVLKANPRVARGVKKGWVWQLLSTAKERVRLEARGVGNRGVDYDLDKEFLNGRIHEILKLRNNLNSIYKTVDSFVESLAKEKEVYSV